MIVIVLNELEGGEVKRREKGEGMRGWLRRRNRLKGEKWER